MTGELKRYPVRSELLRRYIRFFWTFRAERVRYDHAITPQRVINLKFNLGGTALFSREAAKEIPYILVVCMENMSPVFVHHYAVFEVIVAVPGDVVFSVDDKNGFASLRKETRKRCARNSRSYYDGFRQHVQFSKKSGRQHSDSVSRGCRRLILHFHIGNDFYLC